MKTLYLLRHAQADAPAYYDDDHERALTEDGQGEARRLGQFLAETDQVPDQMMASTAVRARRTAALLAEAGHWSETVPLRTTRAFYRGQPADVLDAIQSEAAEVGALLVVGHEPTWSTAVSQFLGAANVSLPEGTCVRIDIGIGAWSDLQFGAGTLRWMVPPSLLR